MALKKWLKGLLIIIFCLNSDFIQSQNQRVADSLAKIYKEGRLSDSARLELLRNLSFNESSNLQLALKYAEELIDLAKLKGSNLYLYRGYLQKGNKKRLLGNLNEALEAYFKSVEAAKQAHYLPGEGSAYGSIADIYALSNNTVNANNYHNKAIVTLRQSKDSLSLASALSNAGDALLNQKEFEKALTYFKESEQIFGKLDYSIGKAYSLGNIGMVYANIGENVLAEKNINDANIILEEQQDFYPICIYLISLSDIYFKKGEYSTALSYAMRSLKLAQKYGFKEQMRDAHLKLSILYEHSEDIKSSLLHYKYHINYRDSINNIQIVQKMADIRTDYEVSQKQVEVDLLNKEKQNQKNIVLSLFIILVLATIILGTLYWYYKTIAREKKRSDNLLLNILPAEAAKELKQFGKVGAVRFEKVTVLFTDFVQFSKYAEHIDPEHLVKSIDYYFKKFDEITTKHGMEKIKTIGDAYMCAGGLPKENQTHAQDAIETAMEIVDFVNKEMQKNDDINHFEVRVGVHTGPVVAGIVGNKKWQYDIWGDTVNIAARLESNSQPGRINISENTYNEIKNNYPCQFRGEIEVKNRGTLRMYFLKE